MGRSQRIPGLIDLVRADARADIRGLADDGRLDRKFEPRGPLINRKVVGFNYDVAQGVEYEIDLREPEGRRIKNLRWRGKPLEDDQKLRLAEQRVEVTQVMRRDGQRTHRL